MLTQETLKAAVYYDSETGEFYARFGTKNRLPWRRLGTVNKAGYSVIFVCGKLYYAHNLAVLYETGCMPDGHTDHINGNKTDNRTANLRVVTAAVNGQNRKHANRNSSTETLGAHKKGAKFRARITLNRKEISLGSFATAEEAHTAYINAKRQLHEGNTL